jgi:hypothetical protein
MLKFPPNDVFIFGLHLVPNMISFGLAIQFYLVWKDKIFKNPSMKQNFYVNNLSHDIPQNFSEKNLVKFQQLSPPLAHKCML